MDRLYRSVRRPLSDEELARLLNVAEDRGRKAWYLAAVLAGLRKGDLQQLRWCDIDFDDSTITIAQGKAKRTDVIPMHPQLADELQRLRDKAMSTPKTKVFPQTVTDRTRQKDFLRAGLAHEKVVLGDDGKPVMIGTGKRQRPKTRIVIEDADGRVVDLHAMRTTLGTNLARAGVAPQLAQRIMRHADYRTTQKHYTVLGITDTAKAIEQLPAINQTTAVGTAATGTTDAMAENYRQQYRQQWQRETGRNHAIGRDVEPVLMGKDHGQSPDIKSAVCGTTRPAATMDSDNAGVTQLVECQPSKLEAVKD